MLPMFGSMSPKDLRAMARQLNAMASALEMAENPHKFMQKKAKAQLSGIKRKIRNTALKNIGI